MLLDACNQRSVKRVTTVIWQQWESDGTWLVFNMMTTNTEWPRQCFCNYGFLYTLWLLAWSLRQSDMSQTRWIPQNGASQSYILPFQTPRDLYTVLLSASDIEWALSRWRAGASIAVPLTDRSTRSRTWSTYIASTSTRNRTVQPKSSQRSVIWVKQDYYLKILVEAKIRHE